MSTYSSSLRVELITSGDQPGQWGNTTNNNFNYIFDKAIAGALSVTTTSLNHVLTYLDGPTPTASLNESVYAILKLDTTTGAAFNVFAPPVPKQYIIWNTNSTHAATLYNSDVYGSTTAAGAGVTIPAGARVLVASDGAAFYGISAVSSISFGTTGLTPSTATSGAVTVAGTLGTANGGTNLTTFGANQVFYASSTSVISQSSALTFDGTTLATTNDALISGLTVGKGAGSAVANTAVGDQALSSGVTSTGNTAVGFQTLRLSIAGESNTAVGRQAGEHIKGNYNVALGPQTLQGNFASCTGIGNVGIGPFALNNFTTATGNIAIGDTVMYGVTTATNSIGIGTTALYSSSGDKNVAIGYESGRLMTSGNKNTIIGAFSGNQGGLDIRTANNYIVLSDGDGNPRAYWNGADAVFNGKLELIGGKLVTSITGIGSSATITPPSDVVNQYNVTALATNATFAAPSGTPADGQKLLLRIKDNGSARTLTWNAIYRAIGVTLPTTTVATKTTYVGCVYNGTDARWDVVAVTTQA